MILKKAKGIHHISAIVGHPQENMNFYAEVLGLRFIKKTVNYEDPSTYHFYFGDEGGNPGTIMTFFPVSNANHKGKVGGGQVGRITFVIPFGSMDFWIDRFNEFFIPFQKLPRLNEKYLQFEDPHGLKLELVERNEGKRNNWSVKKITPEVAIKGFGGSVLLSTQPEKTAEMLYKVLGLDFVGEDDNYFRFRSSDDLGNIIDIKKMAVPHGRIGVGTIHHLAWRAEDDREQLEWKQLVEKNGYHVTDVKNRIYFNTFSFKEPGDILFEFATDLPGFLVDESFNNLGKELKLPDQFEPIRAQIEKALTPIEVQVNKMEAVEK